MPYHGPSGGCITCLSRKIKCDETRPTCNKCAKSKRSCGGYRAMVDLIFRDNTESTKARAGRRELMMIEDSPLITPAGNWPNLSALEASLQPQSIDDQALACFFTDWAWAPKAYTFSLDFLPREYSRVNPERRNCCMAAATRAVSLAHLAHKSRDPRIRQLADAEYVSALSSTNQALSISVEATQDETMMAVHLLILFENIITSAGGRNPSLLPWITHLGGATQLVLKRGPGQLNRDVGAAMFQIQMFKMIVYGMINGQAIPTLFEGAWKETGDHGDAAVRIMKLVSSCPALLERAKNLLESDLLQGEDYSGTAS
ncbi:uncharacterized protein BDZ99DRAFT_193600 [Mytilinidion resinicola]|uniref:Zn(2)-C6 fungal-type domain-containing protein n=1 Tax=Mytilinidion resinicola TaxID=574789 RepID=A0A6A6Z536_9PEZI|nr:uncharacterized protein BDZ99DRAFT_193600 [Mytilinidion resinicola]KAF2815295.1 hypothetical protein BDZ99DRAFT_193600 [Mytilinidion resinicola]